jgi:hypothetical protein
MTAMAGKFLTNPFDREDDPVVPRIKKPKLPDILGKRGKFWIKGFGDRSKVDTVPTKKRPFVGVVMRVRISGQNHLHVDVRDDEGRWYGFCDQIEFEYELLDE